MAHYEDRFCRQRLWSDLIRRVRCRRGSIASTQRPTNSYVNHREIFTSGPDFLHWTCKKIEICSSTYRRARNMLILSMD